MEAPEKIYIQPNAHDGWFETNNLNVSLTEYTRTDAFIERAVEYIANNMRCDGYTLQTKAKFIKDFKNYLELNI